MMMRLPKSVSRLCVALALSALAMPFFAAATGQEPAAAASSPDEMVFQKQVEPLLKKYCLRCHDAETMESGIRVDQVTATPENRQLFLWKDIQKQVDEGKMPPEDEPQPTAEERKGLSEWITRAMAAARARDTRKNGSARRLTVSQYRNTLRDLLGLEEDLTDTLPPDGTSKDGFANNGNTMVLSPLQVETYFNIAEKALDLCLVDENSKPVIQNFRMDFGAGINAKPCPDTLILGANNELLNNQDFVVTELQPAKSFTYEPFKMRTAYEFIEGYVGNDTIRAWKKFDSIYHSVFACMRGSPGYPKGEAYRAVPGGLLLRPAIPSGEIFGQSNTYGPMANFKISLRELPYGGNFRITVRAMRYNDGLLLDSGTATQNPSEQSLPVILEGNAATVEIPTAGIYQVDAYCSSGKMAGLLALTLGEREFSGQLYEPKAASSGDQKAVHGTAFLRVRLPAGALKLKANYGDNSRLKRLAFNRLPDDSESARQFQKFEQRLPSVGVYLGLRRDCGSTLTRVGEPRRVGTELQEFVFTGAINDFPTPDVEKDNVNYLAGIREIAVRSEYTDGREMPRLLIRSVEFEGPYYASWPPATHRNIIPESPRRADPAAQAREILRNFATRAFRRPVTAAEVEAIVNVWQSTYSEKADFQQSLKDALLVVLTAPQFLFLIENSATPDPEDLDSYELASKLSYFLWNTAPDQRLLELARSNTLRDSLNVEFDRMVRDPRFDQFVNEFAAQWFSLDKFDVVAVDSQRYPRLTRDTKTQLRQEPVQFLRHLMQHNLPLRNLVRSDFIVANETVASYYNLADRTEDGFQFVAIKHENPQLGGVLTQAGILAGLSDGRESNPVKRGAWLARKIVAEPPDDPPPNVPQIKDGENTQFTLRQKLEIHRNQKGCVKCHTGIDPWGIPFESFDAGGLLKPASIPVDPSSKLPDGTQVEDMNGLKAYLAQDRIEQVAFSFMKHLATYATGRSLTYNELQFLQEQSAAMKGSDYPVQEMMRRVIGSDLFLKK